MKKLIYFIFISLIFFSGCSEQKWKGKVYKEDDVIVIETEGSGIWGDEINEKISFKENLSIGMPVQAVFRKFFDSGKKGIINYGIKFAPVIE